MQEKWTAFDWKVGLENDFAKDVMGYLTVATGHRPGGFNSIALAGALAGTTFGPEKLISGEIGIKSRFLDNLIQVNADVFYYDYKDYQVADFYFPAGQFVPILVLYNASAVSNKGGEIETQMLLTDSTIGKVSASYLDSSYKDNFWLHGPTGMSNLKGYSLPHSPKYTVKFGLEQTIAMGIGTLTPTFEARWTDKMYTNVFPSEGNLVDGYTIYDFSMLFNPEQGSWSLNMYVKNAADLLYRMTTSQEYPKGGQMGSPRTFGAVFTARF
jgi:iron complex outermembrane recepter protein